MKKNRGVKSDNPVGWRAIFSWCLFDWANSPQPTIIVTFVFSAYFAKGVVGDEIEGTVLWSHAIAASGLLVAVLSPLLGAIADQRGRRKPWVAIFSGGCILSSGALWWVMPEPSSIPLALVSVGIATMCFEFVTVFYNASLPDLASSTTIGRISGWGWGAGYVGAIFCLVLCLVLLIQNETPPLGLDPNQAENIRATALVVVIWWIVFGWPYFSFVPDGKASNKSFGLSVRDGTAALWRTVRNLRDHTNIAKFLVARMLYADGLATLFQFGGLYAAGTFGMDFSEIIKFGIAMNITAGVGAFAFAWLDDWIGSKRTIMAALAGLIGFGALILAVDKTFWFWVFGLSLSLFIGPVQAASRTLLARLSPTDMRAEMFGLYALSGKSTSFLGPMIFGWTTLFFESQRAGMASILGFWIAGLLVLTIVEDSAISRD